MDFNDIGSLAKGIAGITLTDMAIKVVTKDNEILDEVVLDEPELKRVKQYRMMFSGMAPGQVFSNLF